jgi:maleate cis-trans isomerase
MFKCSSESIYGGKNDTAGIQKRIKANKVAANSFAKATGTTPVTANNW